MRRSAATFGLATVLGHLSQLLWLAAGIRVMPAADFGAVLAAQALYGLLQIVIDVGTSAVGARTAARGEVEDEQRAQILRIRVSLALVAAPIAVMFGVLNISGSLAATLPFVLALGLFSVLNVWEPYGSGDARPWATYMFARSAVLALVACACLIAGTRFPTPLAGALECLAIIGVMLGFGRGPQGILKRVLSARGGPWKSVFMVGGPALATQSSLAAGTLVLSGSGSPAKAGIFAACVRLLTGVNAINGIIATSLYPRLARSADEPLDDRPIVTAALRLIALLAAGATGFSVLFGKAVAVAFIGDDTDAAVAALVLTMAAALPLGNILMFAYLMLARGKERATLLPLALGGPFTVVLAICVVAIKGPRVDLVAGSLLIGLLLTATALGLRVRRSCPDIATIAGRSMATAVLVGALACSSLLPNLAVPGGLALLGIVGMLFVALWPQLAPTLGALRKRTGQPS